MIRLANIDELLFGGLLRGEEFIDLIHRDDFDPPQYSHASLNDGDTFGEMRR